MNLHQLIKATPNTTIKPLKIYKFTLKTE